MDIEQHRRVQGVHQHTAGNQGRGASQRIPRGQGQPCFGRGGAHLHRPDGEGAGERLQHPGWAGGCGQQDGELGEVSLLPAAVVDFPLCCCRSLANVVTW